MDINAFNALKTYGAAQKTLTPEKAQTQTQRQSAGETFDATAMAKETIAAVTQSERAASAYMTSGADPHSVVEAMASAELAVETAVTLRNRVVEAYQELLRMPI